MQFKYLTMSLIYFWQAFYMLEFFWDWLLRKFVRGVLTCQIAKIPAHFWPKTDNFYRLEIMVTNFRRLETWKKYRFHVLFLEKCPYSQQIMVHICHSKKIKKVPMCSKTSWNRSNFHTIALSKKMFSKTLGENVSKFSCRSTLSWVIKGWWHRFG